MASQLWENLFSGISAVGDVAEGVESSTIAVQDAWAQLTGQVEEPPAADDSQSIGEMWDGMSGIAKAGVVGVGALVIWKLLL